MNGNPGANLQLRTDFAERVLEAADRLVARRRRLRRMAGASALCAVFAAAAVWVDFSAAPQNAAPSPNRMFAEAGTAASARQVSPDALSWLFPDAEPLARYAADDAADDSDSAGTLFTDDD